MALNHYLYLSISHFLLLVSYQRLSLWHHTSIDKIKKSKSYIFQYLNNDKIPHLSSSTVKKRQYWHLLTVNSWLKEENLLSLESESKYDFIDISLQTSRLCHKSLLSFRNICTFAPTKERNTEKRTKKNRKSITRMLIDSYWGTTSKMLMVFQICTKTFVNHWLSVYVRFEEVK